MSLLKTIKTQRQQQGLSQMALAEKAKVSLATLQNLEAGRANPELSTIASIAEALGLKIEFRAKSVAVDELIPYGLPLLDSSPSFEARPHSLGLLNGLNSIARVVNTMKLDERGHLALTALTSALRDHYPSLWAQVDPRLQSWLSRQKMNGSVIKLRRIALQNLGSYL